MTTVVDQRYVFDQLILAAGAQTHYFGHEECADPVLRARRPTDYRPFDCRAGPPPERPAAVPAGLTAFVLLFDHSIDLLQALSHPGGLLFGKAVDVAPLIALQRETQLGLRTHMIGDLQRVLHRAEQVVTGDPLGPCFGGEQRETEHRPGDSAQHALIDVALRFERVQPAPQLV